MAFVGRERELAQLAGALQRAAGGRLTSVAVTSTAGIGASSLVQELAKRLAGVPGVVVARGCAVEPAAGEAYQAPIDALRSALATVPDERLSDIVGGAGSDLCALVPDLASRLDALVIDRADPALEAPDQLGSRVAESLIALFARLPGTGVLLLALEDLHFADPATRALLRSLIRTSRPMSICLVATYRPEELHRRHPARELPHLLGEASGTEQIHLGPLDRNDLELLMTSLRDERPSGDLVGAVTEGANGNPLVALQLLAAEAGLEGIRLSDSFEQIVGARLAALTPPVRRVARLLAAARQPIAGAVVTRVLGSDGRLPPGALDEAIESGLVVQRDGQLVVSHELYAEAIEDLALPAGRVRNHRLLAAILSDHPSRAAWHLERASQAQSARDAYVAAAALASRLDPGETTLLHVLRALELGADPESPDRDQVAGPLLEEAAHAAAAAGSFRQAAALLRRAIDARAALAGPRRRDDAQRQALGTLHEELGRHLWAGGDLARARDSLEQALALMPAEPSRARASSVATLAQYLMVDGHFAESASLATEAIAVADALDPTATRERGHAACTLGVDLAYLGELDRGLTLLQDAASLARRVGRLDDLMRVAANRTTLLDLDSRREQALAVVSEGIADAETGGLAGTYGAFLRGNAADILYQLGRWEDSERECRAAMEWQPAGVAWFSPTLYLGLVLVESRGDEEAARLVGQTMLQLDTVPVGQWTALVHRAAVSHALWTGNSADAVAVARRGWPRVLETDEPAQVSLAASTCLEAAASAAEDARTRRDMPTLAAASELANLVLPEAEQRIAASSLSPALGTRIEADLHIATARAHEMRVRGRPSPAEWQAIGDAWQRRSIPYLAAKAWWWQALAALNAGRPRGEAAEPLRAAWAIAEQLPARPLQRALSDLAVRGRLPIAHQLARHIDVTASPMLGPDPDLGAVVGRAIGQRLGTIEGQRAVPFGLTPRELEVLVILSEGRTDREIAERLFISERTVQVHMRRVLAKLGASTRTQAASVAIRQGVVATGIDRPR